VCPVILFGATLLAPRVQRVRQQEEHMKIEDVLQKHQERLMAIPGVVGIAEGESDGSPVVLIMVRELTPELRHTLPQQLDGFAVKVDVVGEVTAL
jgi:hypothetical protein